ncbi:MAG: hypothetical protein JWN66_2822 [Sphingomonas bacterium]|uniref:tetratricopeptide repeat protein n=1 Tax=Sphingomonas bacterium TaxID=1895847 RepID=UPI002622C5EF|nr:hypothetical protein [Sphingomonas bacterium]MDB5705706.1 hypothetical protein [Sphingomonas bacterium]
MRGWARIPGLLFAGLMLVGATAASAADKAPSPYDERRDSFMFNGKQNMPYQLYGVTIAWHRECMSGKAARCVQLAQAFEKGFGALPADMRVAIAYWMKSCDMGVGSACTRAATIFRDGSATFVNIELAQKMADRGCTTLKDQSSCAALAESMASAPGGTTDPRATALIDTACAAGADDGCRLKANTLFFEKKDAASRAEALPMFDKACAAKRAWGCLGLATAYRDGLGVATDMARGNDYARIGCTQGQGDRLRLCTLYGISLARPGDKAALNKGENFLDASCTAGDGMACNHIGRVGLSQVSGATTTLEEGLYYLRRGCDLNYGPACSYLSVAYGSGINVNTDTAVALALNQKACRLGDDEGCSLAKAALAADSSLRSRIPAIDPAAPVAEQLRLARVAAESGDQAGVNAVVRLMQEGNEDAQWLLGGWLYYGLPGVFDTSRRGDGLILFENAAKVGHVDAAIYMGMAYWYGDGVAEDRARGEKYMAIAAMRGSQMAGAIYRSMKAEPLRVENARRQAALEEAIRTRRDTWTSSWANWKPSWSAPSSTYTPYSGRSVSQIMDESNFNNAISYYSGGTSACSSSNRYCH